MNQGQTITKPRYRKLIIIITIIIGLWGVLWFGASVLATSLSQHAVTRLIPQMERLNVGLHDLSIETIRVFPLFNGAKFVSLRTRVDLNLRDKINLQSSVEANEIEMRLTNLLNLKGIVRVSGLEVRLDESDIPERIPFNRFSNAQLTTGDLPLAQPRQVFRMIQKKLKELFIENKAVGDFEFSGDVKLKVEDVELIAHLYSEQKGNRFQLRFRESDIQEISDRKGMGLAPEQINIVSYYPLRVPVIMIETNRAIKLSKMRAPKDEWLRDAHRHVIWSFLLTRSFGPDFAKLVTDAQEMRPGNTPNERAMDFHNNAMGRKLFTEGFTLSELNRIVPEDPNIIRHPDDVNSFGEDRLLY